MRGIGELSNLGGLSSTYHRYAVPTVTWLLMETMLVQRQSDVLPMEYLVYPDAKNSSWQVYKYMHSKEPSLSCHKCYYRADRQ